jgi:hypothetical protein
MSNKNFVVYNGLQVGPLVIDAATGSISTTGTVAAGGVASNNIASATSNVFVGSTTVDVNANGHQIAEFTSTGLTIAGTAGTTALHVTGNVSMTGSIIPSANVTYSLGSSTMQWKDIYVGPGSLYVNGVEVLSSSAQNIVVAADANQNLVLQTSGAGDIEVNPTGSGAFLVKGALTLQAGNNINSSDGNAIHFSNQIAVDSLTSKSTNTDLTLTANGTGKVHVASDLNVTGNVTFTGTTTTINTVNLSVEDNIVDLNSTFTSGTPTQNAGIRVLRGDDPATQIRWTESANSWQFTNDGATYYNFQTPTATFSTISAGTIGNTGAVLTGTLSTAAQPNVTSVGTLTTLAVSGSVGVSGTVTANSGVVAPTVSAGTIGNVGAVLTGTLSTAAQPNVTSLGTLSAVTVSGNASISGTTTAAAVYASAVYDNNTRVVSTSSGAGNLTIASGAISLPATGPGAVTVGSASSIPVITTDAYGRIVALTGQSVNISVNLAGTSGTGSVADNGGTLTFAGSHGMKATVSGATVTIDTPQDLETTATPTFAGLTVGAAITGNVSGNSSTATALQTARHINNVLFDGTADITVTAAAGTLTGSTLAGGITSSSLTSVGTLTNLTVTNTITGSVSGNAGTATKLATARSIAGHSFDGSADVSLSTSDVSEGTNLYFTNARAQAAVTTVSGNAGSATKLQTARNINGVAFDGTADITITPANATNAQVASVVTGLTAANVQSVIGSVSAGSFPTLNQSTTGSAASATAVTGLTAANVQAVIGSVSAGSFPVLNQNTTGTAASVTAASQPSITTLAGLTSLGAAGTTTTAAGNFTVTGNLTINGTTNTINNTVVETTEYVQTIDATTVRATTLGNIGANHVGTGTYLTSLTGANVTGTVPAATVAQVVTGLTAANVSAVIGSVTVANFPVLNQNTTGSAASATAVTGLTAANVQSVIGSVSTASFPVLNQNTTGTAANATNAVVAQVVTGLTAANVQSVIGSVSAGSFPTLNQNTTGSAATATSATYVTGLTAANVQSVIGSVSAGSFPTLNQNTTGSAGSVSGSNITGSTLASGVTASSLTSVGTLTGLTVSGAIVPNANVTVNVGSTAAWFNTFYGVSTQAKYADLAENYEGDRAYNPGTVVMFGGSAEVTLADADTTRVAGVVSTNPAHLMNGQLTGPNVVALALQGRVPCNVIGPVRKGDMLVAAGSGYAKASANPGLGQVIGKAVGEYLGTGKAMIEVVVGRV